MPPDLSDFGFIGMGTMGSALALNLASRGVPVAVWDRDPAYLQRVADRAEGFPVRIHASLDALVAGLRRPRKLLMMVTAGPAVDAVIDTLLPLLEPGDVLMDGGNSYYPDTARRVLRVEEKGIHFCGVGISGGEAGARRGASLMFGGSEVAWSLVRGELERVAAQVDGEPCAARVGPDGAGHFVKMVHNGIEYADLQLLAEAYDLLRRVHRLGAREIAEVFEGWSRGPLASYLVENAVRVLRHVDRESGTPLVDLVLDRAAQKGTGRWTVEAALVFGVPVPSITAAVDARLVSARREERLVAEPILQPKSTRAGGRVVLALEDLHDAVLCARILSYAQGFQLIRVASEQHGWGTPLEALARIWRGGCIIRSALLDPIRQALVAQPELPHLVLAPELTETILRSEGAARRAASAALEARVPAPVLTASLAYLDAYRSTHLPQNLTQAQRDAFGAHTYERVDREGSHHTDW